MQDASRVPRRWLLWTVSTCTALFAAALLIWLPAQSSAAGDLAPPTPQSPSTPDPDVAAAAVEWLEPCGLNIVDMTGLVPEEHLRGAILNYETGTGMLEYISGTRSGNIVTIHVKATPRYGPSFTNIGCLSQHAAWDQWLSTTARASVTIFANGRNISNQVSYLAYTPAGHVQPVSGPQEYLRYPKPGATYVTPAASISIPANNGCTIVIHGHHKALTATFRIEVAQLVNMVPLGREEIMANSYIGPGAAGLLAPLAGQMGRYGSRHQKWLLTVPADADYALVKFGPTAFDPYAAVGNQANYGLPGSGTYRFFGSALSVDHVSMIGLPLRGQWRDLDQSGGSDWLGYIPWPNQLAAPEFFLPPGFPFDPCMTEGNCPPSLLDALYNHAYPVQVYYYRVDRITSAPLERIPLRAVGGGWRPSALAATEILPVEIAHTVPMTTPPPAPTNVSSGSVYLPGIVYQPPVATAVPTATPAPTALPTALPPEDSAGCPCGWFTVDGRMVDFVPAP